MFFNKITRKTTECPYRFKTDGEFVNEFGEYYNDFNSYEDFIGWYRNMDYLLGQDFYLDYHKDYNHGEGCYISHNNRGEDLYIERHMLINNEKMLDYNKPKQLVYEKRILSFKKFNDK